MRYLKYISLTAFFALLSFSAQAADNVIEVTFNGNTASVVIPAAITDVTSSVDGAYVSLVSNTVSQEYTYRVSGQTNNGGLEISGVYKFTLDLAGTNIRSQRGAAINVLCGKRIAVVLEPGTENTLSDYAGGEQKAALYFTGHPEFEGAGTLNVTGNQKHAISAKEYLQLKKTVGTINILGAVSDGIHCGKGKVGQAYNYFQIGGGTVNISNVGSDCIDSDDFGSMYIKGGVLNLTVSDGGQGLKCDSVLTMTGGKVNIGVPGHDADGIRFGYEGHFQGGEITINVTGDGSKGIKAREGDATVLGGASAYFEGTNISVTANAGTYTDAISGEDSKCVGISVDKNMTLSAGDVTIEVPTTKASALTVKGEKKVLGGRLNILGQYYTVNPSDYQHDMSVYAVVKIDGEAVADFSQLQIGAFIDGKCHGVATVHPLGDGYYARLRVYDNVASGSEVSFRIYDGNLAREFTAKETMTFTADAQNGAPSSPKVLNVATFTVLGDVNGDEKITVRDIVGIVNIIIGGPQEGINSKAADTNGDGHVTLADIPYEVTAIKK